MRSREFVEVLGSGNSPVASALNFVCILGNDVVSHLVASVDHVHWLCVGIDVCISSINITIR